MKEKMHRSQIYIPQVVMAELRRMSKERGISISELIRNAIHNYLSGENRKGASHGR